MCEATSLLSRCYSPPGMSFFLRKSASFHHSLWENTGSFTTDLNVPCLVNWAESSPSCNTIFTGDAHIVTALCCLKLGTWVPGKCCTFAHCFSVREDDFHMTLEVRHWAAALYWLMVMLDGNMATGCPHTIGPTLGTKFVSQVLSLPLGEMAHALGPW